jgi:hypothetical protein
MFLLSLAHIAIARRILTLSWIGTIAFVQLAVFNFFLMRNLNHIYLLVYTGAIWNWYFLLESLQPAAGKRDWPFWLGIFLGESASIAWGLAGGFPEATFPCLVLGGVLVLCALAYVPWRTWIRAVVTLGLAVAVGIALSAYPVLSFTEGLYLLQASSTRGVGQFRDTYGLGGWVPARQLVRYLVMFEVEGDNIVYYSIGLVPLLLLALGWRLRAWRGVSRAVSLTLAGCAVFFLVHISRLIPALHDFIGSRQPFCAANFYAYFPPLLSGAVAWLVAAAIDRLAFEPALPIAGLRRPLAAGAGIAVLAILLFHLEPHQAIRPGSYLRILPFLVAWWLLHKLTRGPSPAKRQRLALALLVLGLIFLEQCFSMYGFKYAPASLVVGAQFGVPDARVKRWVCDRADHADYRWLWADKIPMDFCANSPDSPASATALVRNDRLKAILFERDLFIRQAKLPYSYSVMGIRWLGAYPGDLARLEKWGVPYRKVGELSEGATLVDLPSSLPRAYLTRDCDWVSDLGAAEQRMARGAFRPGSAVLEADPATRSRWQGVCSPGQRGYRSVPIGRETGDTVSLDAVHGPGMLILSDSYYPGWSVTDQDGQALPILPVNMAFRAVPLESNRIYHLQFRYTPRWLPAARILWIAALLIWVAVLAAWLAPRLVRQIGAVRFPVPIDLPTREGTPS